MILLQPTVGIPAVFADVGNGQFDKAHPALNETAGNEAFPGVGFGPLVTVVDAVEFLGRFALVTEVHQVGHGKLHAGSQLVIHDRGFQLGIPL